MAHRPFKKPIFMRLNSIGNFQARSVWEALEYMDLHWPAEPSVYLRRAKRLCREALDGVIDPEIARRAVIDAAQRAGLLEYGWKRQVDGALGGYRVVALEPVPLTA